MSRVITRRDLLPLDILVLQDVVRFGVLATDQIERRYAATAATDERLQVLLTGGFLSPWDPVIRGTHVYSASRYGARIARPDLAAARPPIARVPHDLALVDLADYLLAEDPSAEWLTEREADRILRSARGPTRRRSYRPGEGHRPDGLLLVDGALLAIELEHSRKSRSEYARICRWFARSTRLHGVRWYVDDPRVGDRIREVNRAHGFDRDIDVSFEPLPPGVVVRTRVGPWTA